MQPTDGYGRSGSADFAESQPLNEFVVTILRYLPLILAFGVLTAVAAFVATTPSPPDRTATTQVGLTQQVVWPFYDTARQRAITVAEAPDFLDDLTERTPGITIEELNVDMPENQAFVVLEVVADTPQNAAIAADEAANLLIERDLVRVTEAVKAEANTAAATLKGSQERVAAIDEQLAELIPELAEAQANQSERPGVASLRQTFTVLNLQINSITNSRNEEIRRQVELTIEANEAQSNAGNVVGELEVLQRAEDPDLDVSRSYVPVAAAMVGALIAGLGLAILWDRARGPLTSRWHADQVAGVPVLAEMTSRRNWERAIGIFLSSLLDSASVHGNVVAITGLRGTPTASWLGVILFYLESAGFKVVAVTEYGSQTPALGSGAVVSWDELELIRTRGESLQGVSTIYLPPAMTLLDTNLIRPAIREVSNQCHLVLVDGGEVGKREADQALALADASVLLARRNLNRVDQLRQAARQIRNRKSTFLGVVLTATRPPSQSKVDRYNDDRTPVAAAPLP